MNRARFDLLVTYLARAEFLDLARSGENTEQVCIIFVNCALDENAPEGLRYADDSPHGACVFCLQPDGVWAASASTFTRGYGNLEPVAVGREADEVRDLLMGALRARGLLRKGDRAIGDVDDGAPSNSGVRSRAIPVGDVSGVAQTVIVDPGAP